MTEDRLNRRNFLRVSGSTIAALGATGVVSGSNSPFDDAKEEFYQRTEQLYGAREAEVATKIAAQNVRLVQRGKLSEQEAYQRTTKRILANPNTPKGSAAIRRVRGKLDALTPSDRERVSTQDNTCGTCGGGSGTVSIDIAYGEKSTDGSYGKDNKAAYDTNYDRQRAYVMTGFYGSGMATARLYGWYTPSSDGSYDITCDYDRSVEVNGAQLTCNIFARYHDPTYGGTKRQTVETCTTSRSGSQQRTANFTLNGGYKYDIGFEIVAEGSSNSIEGDVADAYDLGAGRRVYLNGVTITPV